MLRLGVDRPRRQDLEATLDKRPSEGIPSLHLLVVEHHGENTVVAQHPVGFGEDVRHLGLVVSPSKSFGVLPVELNKPGRVGHCLRCLVCELRIEELRVEMTGCTLQPDIEEVRQLRVLHIVIVWWIDYN